MSGDGGHLAMRTSSMIDDGAFVEALEFAEVRATNRVRTTVMNCGRSVDVVRRGDGAAGAACDDDDVDGGSAGVVDDETSAEIPAAIALLYP